MANDRVLITVKTYPTLSRKYGETVCTAGVCEDGSWVRIYPVPFRRLDETEQYAKYDWIDCKLIKSKSDPRPETRHAANLSDLKPVEHMGTEGNWRDRRKLLLRMAEVHTRLQPLIDAAKANTASLAVFKPAKVIDFLVEEEERNWDEAKVAEMRAKTRQTELFAEEVLAQDVQDHSQAPLQLFLQVQRCRRAAIDDADIGLGDRRALLELPEAMRWPRGRSARKG